MGFDKHYRRDVFYKGSAVHKLKVYVQTLTPTSVTANAIEEQTFTVTGLAVGTPHDIILTVNHPAASGTPVVGIIEARVSAANTLAINFVNPTSTAGSPTGGTYRIVAIRG